jgi:hypothetical protein
MARESALHDSPLLSSAVACRRSAGCSSQSSVNSVRSMRPISRNASASPFCRGYAPSRLSMSDALTTPVRTDAVRRSTSFQ